MAVGGDAGRCHDGENAQQLFQVFRLGDVLVESRCLLLIVVGAADNLHQILIFRFGQAADVLHRRVVEVAQKFALVAIQQGHGVGGVNIAVGGQLAVDLGQLPGLQLKAEVHLAAGFQQALDGLLALPQVKHPLIAFQQLG